MEAAPIHTTNQRLGVILMAYFVPITVLVVIVAVLAWVIIHEARAGW